MQAPFREPKLAGRLLQESACFIRDSIAPGMQTTDFLRKYNDFDVVLALTDVGPKYLLKAQTVSFRRLKKNLYYNNKFVNVLMACMLQHRGKSEPTFLHLTEHFLARGSPCALLGTRNRLTRRTLMEEVWSLPSIQQFHSGLIGKNTEKGEWQILSHDATFKALFSVIGQRKMALAPGEGHALHSLLGLSGALAGLSLQHAEGPKCFADAVTSLLPDEARRTTLWVLLIRQTQCKKQITAFHSCRVLLRTLCTLCCGLRLALAKNVQPYPGTSSICRRNLHTPWTAPFSKAALLRRRMKVRARLFVFTNTKPCF